MPPTLPNLSERERQVVKRLSEGATVGEIAGELGISEKTVQLHSLNARRRIGSPSIAILTRFALRTGISTLAVTLAMLAHAATPLLSPRAGGDPSRNNKAVPIVLMVVPETLTNAFAGYCTIKFAWDDMKKVDEGIVSYVVFTGSQSRVYTNTVATLTNGCAVTNLVADGATNYAAAICVNEEAMISDFSKELAFVTPNGSGPPLTVLTIWWTEVQTNIIVEASSDAKHWSKFTTMTGTNLVTMINPSNNVFFRLNGTKPLTLYFKAQ